MRHLSVFLLLFSCVLFACAVTPHAHAQAVRPITSGDRDTFNELYQAKLVAVRRSRSTDDDSELAAEMLEFASEIPDDPGVQALIYVEAIGLTASSGDLEIMIQTAEKLNERYPGHDSAKPEKLLELAERAYRMAPRTRRGAVADPYLDLLLSIAETAAESGDLKQAITLCRQANTVARAVNSDRRKEIEEIVESYADLNELNNRIEMLSLSVKKNNQNRPAAKELIDLLIIKRDDPEAAAKFVEFTGDDELTELVQLAAKGIENADAATAMRVGDWYSKLANKEGDKAESLLLRAHASYTRFLDVYERKDSLAQRVRLMDRKTVEKLEKIASARSTADNEGWTSLLKDFDFDENVTWQDENFSTQGGALNINQKGSFFVPFEPKSDYQVRIRLKIHRLNDGQDRAMAIYLPVGSNKDRGFVIFVSPDLNRTLSLFGIKARQEDQKVQNIIGKSVDLIFTTSMEEPDRVGIKVSANSTPAFEWEGTLESLTAHDVHTPVDNLNDIIKFDVYSSASFLSIDYKFKND